MTKLEQNIERIEAELAQMKQELEDSKKFKWEYPIGKTFFVGSTEISSDCISTDNTWVNNGRYRMLEANAKYALERNRLANRLEALAEQIEPDYVVPDIGEYTYFIYLYKNEYRNTFVKNNRYIGQVYMSKDTAYKVCELLNSGEVVL